MKSPMVQNLNVSREEKGKYSELMVLRSAAGWYIGTIYTDEDGFQEPGSRDSGYFPTETAAQTELDKINKDRDYCQLRDRP